MYIKHEVASWKILVARDSNQKEKEDLFRIIENTSEKLSREPRKSRESSWKGIQNKAIAILSDLSENFISDWFNWL